MELPKPPDPRSAVAFPAETLDDYTFRMGPERARLSLAVDLITDATIRLGLHRVYTHTPTGKTKRDLDIETALAELEHVRKLLVTSLREKAEAAKAAVEPPHTAGRA